MDIKEAKKKISTGKAAGPKRYLTELAQFVCESGIPPHEFKDVTIVHIYKRIGEKRWCDHHRGISLLSIAGKIFARVLLNPLLGHHEQSQHPESQSGFRSERGTLNMVFAAQQLQEKSVEQHQDFYMTFSVPNM